MDEISKYCAENPISKLVEEAMKMRPIKRVYEDHLYAVGLLCVDNPFVVLETYPTKESLLVGYAAMMHHPKELLGILSPMPEVTPVEFCDEKRKKYKVLDDVISAFKSAEEN